MVATTFRQDTVAGLVAILVAYKAAHPSLLRGVGTARPAGPAFEKPYAYVDSRVETVTHTSGVRARSLTPSVVLLDTFPDAQQAMDRMDILVDGLCDAFTAAPHTAGGNTVDTGSWTIQQTEVTLGEATYRAEIFTFGSILAQEGRL